LRHLLKGPAHLIDMRIVDRVGFESMRGGDFAHVIDVGVADGTFDLYARFPGAFLELFEPDPRYYAGIDAAVLTKRKGRLHRVALGNARGTTTLYLSGPTGSSLYPMRGETATMATPIVRLDQCIERRAILQPCLLKIDTEGHELAILEGATGLLDLIEAVVVEVHFDKPHCYPPAAPVRFLNERGFEIVDVLDTHIRHGHFICADFVFTRNPSEYRSSSPVRRSPNG
jgi:FkbM family methyltransferase